jgi:hypothetical protein
MRGEAPSREDNSVASAADQKAWRIPGWANRGSNGSAYWVHNRFASVISRRRKSARKSKSYRVQIKSGSHPDGRPWISRAGGNSGQCSSPVKTEYNNETPPLVNTPKVGEIVTRHTHGRRYSSPATERFSPPHPNSQIVEPLLSHPLQKWHLAIENGRIN